MAMDIPINTISSMIIFNMLAILNTVSVFNVRKKYEIMAMDVIPNKINTIL